MGDVTPIKRPAPIGNLKPISDPRISAEAIAAAVASVEKPSAFGAMSAPRRAILECLVKVWPQLPTRAELQLCSGLNKAALSEHLQSLRWKGWLMFESLAFAPLTEKRLIEEGILRTGFPPVASSAEPSGSAIAPAEPEEPAPKEFFAKIGKVRLKRPADIAAVTETETPTTREADQDRGDGCDSPHQTPSPVALVDPIEPRVIPGADQSQGGDSQSVDPVSIVALAPLNQPSEEPRSARPQAPRRVATPEPVANSNPAGSGEKPKFRNWMAERRQRLDSAIAFLKTKAILVSQWDKTAMVARYRVSGKRDLKYAEEVIEIAIEMGWAE